MNNPQFVGFDFETSGINHLRSAPIQVGLAYLADSGPLSYGSLIGGWRWTKDEPPIIHGMIPNCYVWSERAQKVHGIDTTELVDAPSIGLVDGLASRWLEDNVPAASARKRIAVGWNVAAFDFPFLRKHLPATSETISYRSVDLNALVFGITEAGVLDYTGKPWTYNHLKDYVKMRASHDVWSLTGQGEMWHNAEYDALTALFAFQELQDIMKGTNAE